jgi:Tfp pilus assembly protein PilF
MRWRPLYGLLPLLAALGPLGCEAGRSYRVKVETPLGVVWLGRPGEPGDAGKAGEGDPSALPAVRVCVAAAESLAADGHAAEAVAQYEWAREIDPGVKVARRLAVLFDREGKPERALTEFRRALREGPRDAGLFNDLGYCYYRQGEYREAESWLRQAVAINPSYDRAWVNLGLALGKQQRYGESCSAFAHAVHPARARANVAVVLAEEGRLEEAKASLRHALAREPDLQLAKVVLAVLEQSASPAAPAQSVTERPAAHPTITHKPSPKEEDGPWLPDLAE